MLTSSSALVEKRRCRNCQIWPKYKWHTLVTWSDEVTLIGRVSYLIYVSMRHYALTTFGVSVTSSYVFVRQCVWVVNLLITLWRFQFVIGQFIPKGKRSYPGSQNSENAVADDPVLKFLYDADFTSCRILSAMSPEIQEWSHKSRSRINNLYLLTRPIFKCRHRSCGYVTLLYRTGNVGYHIGYHTHTNVFTLQGLHSWKVAIL